MPHKRWSTPMLGAHEFGTMLSNNHLPRGLSYGHAWFLMLLRVRPSLTRADYQAATGVSAHTAQADLVELLQARLIVRTGSGPATRYCLHPHVDPTRDYFLTESALQSTSESLQNRPAIPAGTQPDRSEIAPPSPRVHTKTAPVRGGMAAILRRTFSRGE